MINIKAAINEQAREEEARKIKLENIFRPSVNTLFNQMANAFENLYLVTGRILEFDDFKDDWSSALKIQYRRVGKEFTNNTRKSIHIRDLLIKQEEDELTLEEIAALAASYLLFSQNRAREQTEFIISTSNKDALDSVLEAAADLRDENPLREPTNQEVARSASKKLRKKFRGRLTVITNMETQSPAEMAKELEAKVIAKQPVLPFQTVEQPPERIIKQWVDVRLPNVRDAHAVANGQKVDINSAFTVGGQLLNHPGDTSLGATIDNVANCRCAAFHQKV